MTRSVNLLTIGSPNTYPTNNTETIRGPLGDGYYWTTWDTTTSQVVRLFSTSDMTVPLGTAANGTNYVTRAYNTAAGSSWCTRNTTGGSAIFASVSRSGTAVAFNNRGTAVINSAYVHVAPDDSQMFHWNGGGTASVVYGRSTTDLSLSYTLNLTTHGTGQIVQPFAAPRSDRVLAYCQTHAAMELWSGSGGTLLSSLSYTLLNGSFFTDYVASIPLDTSSVLIAQTYGTAPVKFDWGILSTSGDTLSWSRPVSTLTTDWTATAVRTPSVRARGSLASFVNHYSGYPSTFSMYVLDTATGTFAAAAPSVYGGMGAYVNNSQDENHCWPATDRFVINPDVVYDPSTFSYFLGTWSSWIVRAGSTYLRRRQSPAYTPSRVRGVDLRQRQTPRIT